MKRYWLSVLTRAVTHALYTVFCCVSAKYNLTVTGTLTDGLILSPDLTFFDPVFQAWTGILLTG